MKTNAYLLPNRFRVIGWIISIPSAIVSLYHLYYQLWRFTPGDYFAIGSELAAAFMLLLMVGLLFVAFSKEKIEDEYITKVRGDSLIWAVIANAVLMAVLALVFYGVMYITVLSLNLYTVLVLFIIKFNIAMSRVRKEACHEK